MDFTTVKENLEKHGYAVSVFERKEDAAEYIVKNIRNCTIGFGGSMTLTEMGLYESLSEENTVFWHWQPQNGKTANEMRDLARNADAYISSVNGLAETGEIVNIDGTCNRVSEIMYGHKKVILVVGKNKIAPDYDGAYFHARNVAAPKNAQRLGRNTPCAKNGDKCYDCKSPERICRGLSVLWTKPGGSDYEIILVNEDMGY